MRSYQLTMSSTDSVHSTEQTIPAEQVQQGKAIDEYEDAEKSFQLKSPKFWTIIIGMYLSIFLVALVGLRCTGPVVHSELTFQ